MDIWFPTELFKEIEPVIHFTIDRQAEANKSKLLELKKD